MSRIDYLYEGKVYSLNTESKDSIALWKSRRNLINERYERQSRVRN